MFSFEGLEFLLVLKVLNCVFVIVFAVWTCGWYGKHSMVVERLLIVEMECYFDDFNGLWLS